MVEIVEIKKNNEIKYPVTHKKAVVGLEKNDDGIFNERLLGSEIPYQEVTSSFNSIEKLKTKISINDEGLLMCNGWFNVKIQTTSTATLTFIPYVEQKEVHEIKNTGDLARSFISVGGGTFHVPFSVMFPVTENGGDCDFNCLVIVEGSFSSCQIRRTHIQYAFIPQVFKNIVLGHHYP